MSENRPSLYNYRSQTSSLKRLDSQVSIYQTFLAKRIGRTEGTLHKILSTDQAERLMAKQAKKTRPVPVEIRFTDDGIQIIVNETIMELQESSRALYDHIKQIYVNKKNSRLVMLSMLEPVVQKSKIHETYEFQTSQEVQQMTQAIVDSQQRANLPPMANVSSVITRPQSAGIYTYDRNNSDYGSRLESYYSREYSSRSLERIPIPRQQSVPYVHAQQPFEYEALRSVHEEPRYRSYSIGPSNTYERPSNDRWEEFRHNLGRQTIFLKKADDGVVISPKGPIYLFSERVDDGVENYWGTGRRSETNSPVRY